MTAKRHDGDFQGRLLLSHFFYLGAGDTGMFICDNRSSCIHMYNFLNVYINKGF